MTLLKIILWFKTTMCLFSCSECKSSVAWKLNKSGNNPRFQPQSMSHHPPLLKPILETLLVSEFSQESRAVTSNLGIAVTQEEDLMEIRPRLGKPRSGRWSHVWWNSYGGLYIFLWWEGLGISLDPLSQGAPCIHEGSVLITSASPKGHASYQQCP